MPKKQASQEQRRKPRRAKRNGQSASAPGPAERLLSQLPDHSSADSLRQAGLLQAQREGGNQAAGRLIQTAPQELIQRDKAKGKAKKGGTHGRGPGSLKHATEVTYDVSGATLNDITGQLHRFGGFGAEYSGDLGLKSDPQVKTTKDKKKKVKVQWKLKDVQVQVPRWVDYDQACPAAQAEWDRFMSALRAHEQAKHVDMAEDWVKGLSGDDVEIVADSTAELQTKLDEKLVDLGARLQGEHDACGHGTGTAGDAVLQPDNGSCEEETEEQAEDSSSSSSAEESFGGFEGDF